MKQRKEKNIQSIAEAGRKQATHAIKHQIQRPRHARPQESESKGNKYQRGGRKKVVEERRNNEKNQRISKGIKKSKQVDEGAQIRG